MDNIKVSVIVPVYNGEKYIQTSISSIINQEFSENYEIIVVDDGSDDNSLDIAQELLSKSDIPYKLVHQRNSGVSVARNNGIEVSIVIAPFGAMTTLVPLLCDTVISPFERLSVTRSPSSVCIITITLG